MASCTSDIWGADGTTLGGGGLGGGVRGLTGCTGGGGGGNWVNAGL